MSDPRKSSATAGSPPCRETIPADLTDRDHWVCWRTECRECSSRFERTAKGCPECGGTATKTPIDPNTGRYASTKNSDTWATFESAVACHSGADHGTDGLGFVFTTEDPLVGVDLDNCRDPEIGEIEPWARDIVDLLDSFTEISPSGTGLHVYVSGSVPAGGHRNGNVEMYDDKRYFTVTGTHVGGTPATISTGQKAIREVHSEHIANDDERAVNGSQSRTVTNSSAPIDLEEVTPTDAGNDLADSEVLEVAEKSDDPKFARLWHGDTSGYESHSEPDLALCNKLAFYTGCDSDQMDRLFRDSGLYRDKWDRTDYRERTIAKAIRDTDEV